MDNILFEDYIKRKTVVASRVITDGILYGGIDWYSMAKPTGERILEYLGAGCYDIVCATLEKNNREKNPCLPNITLHLFSTLRCPCVHI